MGSSCGDNADVLVVDDGEILRRELTDSLNGQGIRAVSVGSGGEAVQLAKECEIKVAVVDLKMPGMDGIQTAQALQAVSDTAVIFFSGFGSEAYRSRAVDAHLVVEQWIDKDPSDNPFESAIKAVTGVLKRRQIRALIAEVDGRLAEIVARGVLTSDQLITVKAGLDLPSILVPKGVAISRRSEMATATRETDGVGFDELLSLLAQYKDDLLSNYGDPAHREMVWGRMRTLIEKDLWKAVSAPPLSSFLQQLVVQLEQAVRRLPAALLERKHIDAFTLTLERMSSTRVDESDVASCKKKWRATGVDTLPSFESIMREWETLYAAEGPDDPTDQDPPGDDHPTPQNS